MRLCSRLLGLVVRPGRATAGAGRSRSLARLTFVSLALLPVLVMLWTPLLWWLTTRHLMELIQPAATTLGAIGLAVSLGAVRRSASGTARSLGVVILLLLAVAPLGGAHIWLGATRAAEMGFAYGSNMSHNGALLTHLGGPLPGYSARRSQNPLVLLDVERGRQIHIGMTAVASHTPNLSTWAFDASGCRAAWLRLRPDPGSLWTVVSRPWHDASRLAERWWPAELMWLDACADGRPIATGLEGPPLGSQLTFLQNGKLVAALTESLLWLFDVEAGELVAELELPRDELEHWIIAQTLAIDGSRLTMARKQYLPSRLETLEIDLEAHSVRRVSLLDFEAQPKPGFDLAEADLLVIEPNLQTAVVRRRHTRWQQPQRGEHSTELELYSLTEGRRLRVLGEAQGQIPRDAALYLEGGALALADELRPDTGILRVVSREGELLAAGEWPQAGNFRVLRETPRGAILVAYRNRETGDDTVDLFDPVTGETLKLVAGYFPIGRAPNGVFVASRDEVLEVGEGLDRRVVLSVR